jgi:hypothetical protein
MPKNYPERENRRRKELVLPYSTPPVLGGV